MTSTYERTWEARRSGVRTVADEARTSYYGVPVIHKPHWKWLIILYFFFGGISGASYTVASIADLLGGRENRRIARVGHYVSLLALIPCPILLILDLGRPERFHHMLRVLKLRSPMSVGTWGLTVFGAFCTLAAAVEVARDGLIGQGNGLARMLLAVPSRPIQLIGSVPAFFVAGYTGVLLAATAVPLWTKAHLLMGPLFLASALSNATAAIALILSLRPKTAHHTLRRLERLDTIALIADAVLLLATYLRLGPKTGRHLMTGRVGLINAVGVLGCELAIPLALQARAVFGGAAVSRWQTALSAVLVLIGGLAFRYVMVVAGRQSADDPEAVFEWGGRRA